MKYKHRVKHNGIYYNPGEEVPEATSAVSEEKKAEKKDVTKSDIMRMQVDDLKVFAAEIGIVVTEQSTGMMLKTEIIKKLGL